MATAFTAQAQYTDIQINPIGALFGNLSATAEFPVAETVGIEPAVGLILGSQGLSDYKSSGFGLGVNAKFYFNPEDGHDKFYAGAYTRFSSINNKAEDGSIFTASGFPEEYSNTRLALGALLGYKWVADNGLVFELAIGGGRALLNNNTFDDGNEGFENALDDLTELDLYGRLSLGYRLQR